MYWQQVLTFKREFFYLFMNLQLTLYSGGEQTTQHSQTSASVKLPVQGIFLLLAPKLDVALSQVPQRFEHKTTDKTSPRKIDSAIRFPASLNMAPYTTLVMNLKGKDSEKENERIGAPTTT